MSNQTTPMDPPGGCAAQLAEIARLVDEMRPTIWAARSSAELMENSATIEELMSRLAAAQLAMVRELEVRGDVKQVGWASTQDFVTAVSGGHKGTGHATVRLAKALDEPLYAPVAEALGDGWLSVAKAHVVERAIERLPLKREIRGRGVQLLLDEAKRLDASDLAKAGRRMVEVVDPDGEERRAEKDMEREERAAHLGRDLSVRDDGAGGAIIRGRCAAEDAATIRATLLPLAKPQPTGSPDCDPATCDIPGCSHDGRDPRDHGARMLDALIDACRRLQDAEGLPESHGARPRVNVTIDLEDLTDPTTRGTTGWGTTDTGEDLAATTVRTMACDADLIPVVLAGPSAVLDVGRQQRLVTTAIWHALVVRDHRCRFPGCTRPPVMCHAHHLVHWADGGPTSLDNLVLLCGHHHRLVHAGPWQIRQPKPGLFQFTPPDAVRRAHRPRPDRAPPAD